MNKQDQLRVFLGALLLSALLTSCGGNGNTDSGAATADNTATNDATGVAVVGPDLNGSDWAGYIKSERDGVTNLTATITHQGNQVTIVTSKDGLAHELVGTINAVGETNMRDLFDNEQWTSVYGNVSQNSINLGDYIANDQGRIIDQNILVLKR